MRQRTEKTHAPDGSLTQSEMERRERAWADEQPMTSRCALDGCGWEFTGPAADAIAAAAAHRRDTHGRRGAGRRAPAPPRPPQPTTDAVLERKKSAVLDGIRAYAAEHGHPPSINGWHSYVRSHRALPTVTSVATWFGTWAAAIAAAGFDRPTNGTSYRLAAGVRGRRR